MAANQALAQMDPCITHFQAFFAAVCVGMDMLNFAEMCTLCAHNVSFLVGRDKSGPYGYDTLCNLGKTQEVCHSEISCLGRWQGGSPIAFRVEIGVGIAGNQAN